MVGIRMCLTTPNTNSNNNRNSSSSGISQETNISNNKIRKCYSGSSSGSRCSFCLLLLAFFTFVALFALTAGCTSRTAPKPRPQFYTPPPPDALKTTETAGGGTTSRPNITFPIFNCPPTYAAWYCLNDATCFTVEIHNEILYNCECAIGYMGPRCEYKEIDGSYLPTRQRVMLEKASIVSGATLALLFMIIFCMILYIRHEKQVKMKLSESNGSANGSGYDEDVDGLATMTTPATTLTSSARVARSAHYNEAMDEVDGLTKIHPPLRPFGVHHYPILSLEEALRRANERSAEL